METVPRIEPGARVGPFEVVRHLARGGMGELYEARDPSSGEHVALKVIGALDDALAALVTLAGCYGGAADDVLPPAESPQPLNGVVIFPADAQCSLAERDKVSQALAQLRTYVVTSPTALRACVRNAVLLRGDDFSEEIMARLAQDLPTTVRCRELGTTSGGATINANAPLSISDEQMRIDHGLLTQSVARVAAVMLHEIASPGNDVAEEHVLSPAGGSGGDAFAGRCPVGQVLVGFRAGLGFWGDAVSHVAGVCAPSHLWMRTTSAVTTTTIGAFGNDRGNGSTALCPRGDVLTGLDMHEVTRIDGVRVVENVLPLCRRIAVAPAE